jgi:hypothetical protein
MKDGRLYLRLSAADKAVCEQAALAAGLKLSEWIRRRLAGQQTPPQALPLHAPPKRPRPAPKPRLASKPKAQLCQRCARVGAASCDRCRANR